MNRYDDIVVGSGISGMTMAQLLGLCGRKVLLLEKASIIGGSMARFYRKGIPFDTGFHFTGGFGGGALLKDMLEVLKIEDDIKPIFLKGGKSNRFIFKSNGKCYEMPPRMPDVMDQLIEYFPDEEKSIRAFFDKAREICDNTPLLDIRKIDNDDIPTLANLSDDDFISLKEALDKLTDNIDLKGLLGAYSLCYGTRPEEVSLANHCRISLWLFESIARVERGGGAFIDAFRNQFKELGVDVKTRTYITECLDLEGKRVSKVKLNTGEEIEFENCILGIHPKEILNLLPAKSIRKAFKERISDFEDTLGFFSVYGYLKDLPDDQFYGPSLNSVLTSPNLDKVMDPDHPEEKSLVIMTTTEKVKGETVKVVNAFETSFYEHEEQFDGERTEAYTKYKEDKCRAIEEEIYQTFPEYQGHLSILETASQLTFKDYLNSPYGSAYGIKQKVGQINLFGRLPVRNMFSVGQSSLLPGLVGAMMSSFIVAKSIIGKEKFRELVE